MELLATNPRLISPCIDLPLASVQIERPGSLTSSSGVPGYYYHMTAQCGHHHHDCEGNNNMETKEDVLLPLVKHHSVGGCGGPGYIYVCHQ